MSNINFGLKLWSNDAALLAQAQNLISDGIFQYVELLAVPGTDTSVFEKIKIPYILHVPHDSFGFNIGEKDSWDLSFKILEENIKLADRISAKYLILHPGFGELKTAKKFLSKISDKRILIENMTKVGANNEKMIGYDAEQIKELQKDKFGFCLDFEHAIRAAMDLKTNPKEFIKKFLSLNPKVFHICDGKYSPGRDEHLNIGEGEYDSKFFLDCVNKNDSKFVTLETPKGENSLANDIKNLKKIKNYIN